MEKERLDVILYNRGLFESREKAKSSIMAGIVYINNVKEDKPGTNFAIDSEIEIRENVNPYVSRGGLKLEKAIKYFKIDLMDKVALDIGASTGGFTDCMLKNGAKKVYAIDVGYGQLAWVLRTDERVVCMERTNVRYVKAEQLGELGRFASVDVSFISLTKVLLPVALLLEDNGEILCLIKPQFEAGREKVGKKGVVRDAKVHEEVIEKVIDFSESIGLITKGLTFSPIKGPEGNIEYLVHLMKNNDIIKIDRSLISDVVGQAHGSL